MAYEMNVWPGFFDGLGARASFGRLDEGWAVGDEIEFVDGERRTRRVVTDIVPLELETLGFPVYVERQGQDVDAVRGVSSERWVTLTVER